MAIDKRWIVNLKGKDFVLWAGLLDAATKAGLRSIEVNLIQFPSAENGNLAISQATATFEDGRLFTEIGDAGPANCPPMIAAHACRMSATRAKGRALRDALNIGETMFEELGPDAESQNGHQAAPAPRQRARHDPEDEAARKREERAAALCEACGEPVPEPVAVAARKRFGKVLCLADGKAQKDAEKPTPATLQGA